MREVSFGSRGKLKPQRDVQSSHDNIGLPVTHIKEQQPTPTVQDAPTVCRKEREPFQLIAPDIDIQLPGTGKAPTRSGRCERDGGRSQ